MHAAIEQEAAALCNCSLFSNADLCGSSYSFRFTFKSTSEQINNCRYESKLVGGILDGFLVTRSWEGEFFFSSFLCPELLFPLQLHYIVFRVVF